jgi:hypothetical protein
MEPITQRWNQFTSQIQNAIVFIRKAWAWVDILWTAQTAIEGFNYDAEEIVELWLVNHQSAFKPGRIPLMISALMFLEPDLLKNWLENYEPGQFTDYTHPEQLESFGEIYGSFIRQSGETQIDAESRIPSATNSKGGE